MQFPTIHRIEKITIENPDHFVFENGIDCYGYNGAVNDIIKVELVFDAGRWTETQKHTAAACSSLIKSGTKNKTAVELEEAIDFLGSTIQVASGYNTITFSVFSIHKNLAASLELLIEILTEFKYPEEELKLYKQRSIARFSVNQNKNDYIADSLFKAQIFGAEHPYGYETHLKDLELLNRASILDYASSNISVDNCTAFVSGSYNDGIMKMIDTILGAKDFLPSYSTLQQTEKEIPLVVSPKITKQIPEAVQASINIGKIAIRPSHEDYQKMVVLNTIFGGYFGSRLMKNIREDKGYTYGIYGGFQNYREATLFNVSTDTSLEYVKPCLEEIYKEAHRLKEEKIGEEELDRVKRYKMGQLLKMTDGAFTKMSTFKQFFITNRNINNIQELATCLKEVNAASLLEVAQKHLNIDSLNEVVVS